MSRNTYKGVDPKIVNSVRYYAWKLKSNICFASEETEDLEQDLMVFVISKLSQFDCDKSQIGTFVGRILKNHVLNLIRDKSAKKSLIPQILCSVDTHESDVAVQPTDMIKSADINSFVIKKLPLCLRQTFELLKSNDVRNTAKLLNKSIGTIYLRIAKIRKLMDEFANQENEFFK